MAARSLNKVLLIGNLTRDPELRYTPQGTAVCTIGIATNRQWTPADGGERKEEVEYHRIVAWAKLAEICAQILHKGRKVYVEGRLQTRTWAGQDGQERSTTEVVIDTMIALGPPRPGVTERTEESAAAPEAQPSGASPAQAGDDTAVVSEDTRSEGEEPKKKQTKKKEAATKKASEEAPGGEEKAGGGDDEVSEEDIPF
ncbi:single-stranded DNA-binding protein [Patescibacteria group bacterium]|nr:single-stranded DNA-binding protein [Patescibacteria group bacterium]